VRIARVHAATFGDRLVAKFGLPVRGFRDARRHDPGHGDRPGPQRADPRLRPRGRGEEGRGGGTDDDA
jgi:NAD+ kinase